MTRELLAEPAPNWRWRISVADIQGSGAFSAYPGVSRWFAVVQGAGVVDLGPRFGKTDNLLDSIRQTAHREGVGDILAEGSRRMALRFGEEGHAMNVKGQELAAYNPINAYGQGLSYATANRGACHLNGGYLVLLEGLGLSAKGRSTASKAQLGAMFQCLMEAISCSGICLFTSYAVFPSLVLKNRGVNKVFSAVLSVSGPAVGFALRHPRLLPLKGLLVPYPEALARTTGMPMNLGRFLAPGARSYRAADVISHLLAGASA